MRKFIGTYVYSILLLAVVIIIFDFAEKFDDFQSKKAPVAGIIFDYYLNFLPYFVNMFSALFTFIAVTFFTSKMASNTEIVAILNGGISFKRFLKPYFVGGMIITVLSFVLMNYVIPFTNRDFREFEKKYIKNKFVVRDVNIHMQIEPNTYVYVESFRNIEGVGYKFSLEKFRKNEMVEKINAEEIRWDSIKQKWQLNNFDMRKIYNDKEVIRYGSSLDTAMGFKPEDFAIDIEDSKIMTYTQLTKFIKREKMRGNGIARKFDTERAKRVAFPFANLILTFIGVSLSSRKVRGGIGMHMGLGIAIAFTYIILQQITSVFSVFGNLPADIALWIPNIIYAVVALYLLKVAPK